MSFSEHIPMNRAQCGEGRTRIRLIVNGAHRHLRLSSSSPADAAGVEFLRLAAEIGESAALSSVCVAVVHVTQKAARPSPRTSQSLGDHLIFMKRASLVLIRWIQRGADAGQNMRQELRGA